MSRRVVVTGMGAISPIGNDVPTMWKNMVDGVCGIETITAFDTSDLKVHIAGTVKDFDPTQYIEKKEVRKLDPYTQYAIAAAQQAVDDSGIIGKIDENRFGVYIGAGIRDFKACPLFKRVRLFEEIFGQSVFVPLVEDYNALARVQMR